ncbi:MAG: hypothetical protein EHM52_01190 [Actinomycetota bacterium]|nr:MAG: hypothetical protein EHM52_01190 [Actinomycetota bacterium]
MSTAPEVWAAGDCGAAVDLIALVVNRAAAVGAHGDVLAAAAAFEAALRAVLGPLLDDVPAGPAATAPPPSHP